MSSILTMDQNIFLKYFILKIKQILVILNLKVEKFFFIYFKAFGTLIVESLNFTNGVRF